MLESTLTIKGQTTVPRQVRERMGLQPGDRLRYLDLGNGEIRLVRAQNVSRLSGLLHRPDRAAVSLEEMDEAIADGAADG